MEKFTSEQLKIQEQRIEMEGEMLKKGAVLSQEESGDIVLRATNDQVKDAKHDMRVESSDYASDKTLGRGPAVGAMYLERGRKNSTKVVSLEEMGRPILINVEYSARGLSDGVRLRTILIKEESENADWKSFFDGRVGYDGFTEEKEQELRNMMHAEITWEDLSLNDKKQIIEEIVGKKFMDIDMKKYSTWS